MSELVRCVHTYNQFVNSETWDSHDEKENQLLHLLLEHKVAVGSRSVSTESLNEKKKRERGLCARTLYVILCAATKFNPGPHHIHTHVST